MLSMFSKSHPVFYRTVVSNFNILELSRHNLAAECVGQIQVQQHVHELEIHKNISQEHSDAPSPVLFVAVGRIAHKPTNSECLLSCNLTRIPGCVVAAVTVVGTVTRAHRVDHTDQSCRWLGWLRWLGAAVQANA